MSEKTYRGIRIETESVYSKFSGGVIKRELVSVQTDFVQDLSRLKTFTLRVLLYGYFDSQNELRTTINGKSK